MYFGCLATFHWYLSCENGQTYIHTFRCNNFLTPQISLYVSKTMVNIMQKRKGAHRKRYGCMDVCMDGCMDSWPRNADFGGTPFPYEFFLQKHWFGTLFDSPCTPPPRGGPGWGSPPNIHTYKHTKLLLFRSHFGSSHFGSSCIGPSDHFSASERRWVGHRLS